MTRLRDWEERFCRYLEEARMRPHEYGEHDCLLHCAAAVEAITGEDLAAEHRGKYDSASASRRYLKGLGFDSPAAMISSLLPDRPPAFARRGDLVAGADGIPGVCLGSVAAFVGTDPKRAGLVTTPRREWAKAWTVGEGGGHF